MQPLEKDVSYLYIHKGDQALVANAGTLGSVTLPKGTQFQVDQLEGTVKHDAAGSERGEFFVDDGTNEYANLFINGKSTLKLESDQGRGVGKPIGPFTEDKTINLKVRGGNPATLAVAGALRLRRRKPKPTATDEVTGYLSDS